MFFSFDVFFMGAPEAIGRALFALPARDGKPLAPPAPTQRRKLVVRWYARKTAEAAEEAEV